MADPLAKYYPQSDPLEKYAPTNGKSSTTVEDDPLAKYTPTQDRQSLVRQYLQKFPYPIGLKGTPFA